MLATPRFKLMGLSTGALPVATLLRANAALFTGETPARI